jgi:hypothetical protein
MELKTIRSGTKAPLAFVENVECGLLLEWNLAQPKLHDQCIFVRLLNDSVAKCIQNLDCTANNLKDFLFEQ